MNTDEKPEIVPVLPVRLPIRTLLSTPPKRYDMVLPGLPKSRVGLLVAPGGTGKSRLLLEWAVGVALGLSWPWPADRMPEREPAKVVVLAGEDDQQDIHVRLSAIGGHQEFTPKQINILHQNLAIHVVPGWHFVDALKLGRLPAALLKAMGKRPRLIIADPLARLASYDEIDTRQATHLVEVLEQIARKSGASIVAAHHVSKGAMRAGELSAQQAARGAAALTDGVRWQANLVAVPEAIGDAAGIAADDCRFWRQVVIAKSNYSAPVPDMWLRLEGTGGVLVPQDPPIPAGPAATPANGNRGGANNGRVKDIF